VKDVNPNTPVKAPSASPPTAATPYRQAFPARSLIALTHDGQLLAILRRVSDNQHAVHAVGSEVDLSGALMAQNAGVAILDCAALATNVTALAQRLQAQFPELVLIVAGSADDQGLVAAQITDGTVHRFLHKPFSEQRVRLFAESAWKRQEQADALPEIHAPARRTQQRNGTGKWWVALLGVLVVSGAGAAWLFMQSRAPLHGAAAASDADAALEALITHADQALAAGRLVAPQDDNAAALYRAALQRSPNDTRAVSGLEQVIEHLLTNADQALQQRQLDAAQQLVEQARALSANHPRVAFLAAQIGAQRERAVLSKVQRAAAGGNVAGAIAALDSVAHPGDAATSAGAAPAAVTAPGAAPGPLAAPPATSDASAAAAAAGTPAGAGVADYLARASAALSHGQLIEPVEDNARFYIAAARALAPDNADVQQASLDLIARLSSEARQAVADKNTEQADIWTAAAADAGADPAQIETLHQAIAQLRSAASAETLTRLSSAFKARLEQGQVMEPATDSAKFFLAQLTQADAASQPTLQAKSAYGRRALEEARKAFDATDVSGARRWLAEARSAGADAAEVSTLEGALNAAQSRTQESDSYVNEATLTRTHYVTPKYPELASQRALDGWVDLQFLVGTDGSVSDAAVVGAQPAGIFEQAAIEAVQHWRYQPVMRDGHAINQRARVRVRFAVQQ
jgi:protein TonB